MEHRAVIFLRFIVLAFLYSALVLGARAQMPVSSSTTSTPVPGVGHDYLGEFGETVNPATGSLSIRIKAMMPPGRGFTLPFSFAYDSSGVNYVGRNSGGVLQWLIPSNSLISTGGWSNTVPVVTANELTWTATNGEGGHNGCWAFVNYVYQDAHGDRHNLNLTTYNQAGSQTGSCTTDSTDWPSGFSAQVARQGGEQGAANGAILASIPTSANIVPGPVTVIDADGTTLSFPNVNQDGGGTMATGVEDRNGNVVTITPPVYPATNYSYVDTAGRTVLQDTGFAVSPETVTISGLNGSYRLNWTSLGTPGFVAPVTPLSGSACNFGGNHQAWGTTQSAVSSLTLPNNETFTFAYDSTFQVVNKITYPTGGYVRYVWGFNSEAEFGTNITKLTNDQCTALYGVPVITDRYVSFDGSTEVLHQQFAYTTSWNTGSQASWTSKQTIVTTTDNVRGTSYSTTYAYSPLYADHPPNTSGAPTSWDPVESSVAYSDTNGAPLKTVYKTWTTPRTLTSEETQFPNGQANETKWTYNSREQQTEQDDYDFGSSGVGSLLRKTVTNYQQFNLNLYTNGQTIADRPCQVVTYDSSGTNRVAETDYFYDNGATTTPCGTAGTPSLTPAGGSSLTGHDEGNYSATSTTPRGNLTQKTQWLKTGTSPSTTYAYDETGQVLSVTDPNINTTNYSYADSFLNTNSSGFTTTAGSPPSGMVSNAFLTTITYPPTSGVAHIRNFWYGYNDGELTQSSDENSPQNLTMYKYNDKLGRLTETDYPDGGQTSLSYNDSIPSVTTTRLIGTSPSVNMSTTSIMDGLAHVTQTQLTTDPDGTTYTATTYDGDGRKYQVYNPTRCSPPTTNCGTEPTWGMSTYTYDGLGRTKQVTEADGSTVQMSYGQVCTVNSTTQVGTTVTDELGNQRQTCVDGLGRLTAAFEAPNVSGYNFETDYAFDALGNLLSANQKGGSSNSANWRTRTFTYDSLSRLVCAANPEIQAVTCPSAGSQTFPTGAVTYVYDANGNMTSRVMPKAGATTGTAVTTHNYTYDALNRMLQDSHLDPSQGKDVYGYDGIAPVACPGPNPPSLTGATNLIGSRSAMCSNQTSSSFSYDPMGRVATERRTNKGSSNAVFSVGYTYWLDGSLHLLTYPSGDVLTYVVGGAGRATQVTDSGTNFVTGATYAPQGALALMTNAYTGTSGIVTSNAYNSRLQPILLSAGSFFSLCYDFHLHQSINNPPCTFNAYSTGNNGNVFQILNNTSTDATQQTVFQYDPLNRISQGNTVATTGTNCWGENYTIDGWGNLTNIAGVSGMGSCVTELMNYSPTTQNHLGGLSYDIAGNVLNDPTGNVLTYDAENRIATDAGNTYSYDADGFRMEKANGSSGTMYWPGPSGTLTESDVTGTINEEYVFFDGERVARIDRPAGTVHYYFSDHLQSTSVITDALGNVQERCSYFPYGGQLACTGSDPNHYKFTGKERDAESGLDMFGARYYGSSLGRFMTPDWAAKPTDVPYANFGNPQSLNLYSYVNNNPTTTRDPDGHCPPCDDGFWDFAGAAANAYGSDNLLGAGRTDQPTTAGRIGAAVGDFAATVQGGAETLFGGGVEVGGVALDATGVGAVAGVPANVAGAGLMLHGGATAETGFSNLFKSATDPSHKGATTEPTLPSKTVASEDGVTVQHFTRSGDHGPAHLHVEGNGPSTRIGMNGKPLKGDAELSSAQKAVVDNNKGAIRSAVDKIQRWFKFNNQ